MPLGDDAAGDVDHDGGIGKLGIGVQQGLMVMMIMMLAMAIMMMLVMMPNWGMVCQQEGGGSRVSAGN